MKIAMIPAAVGAYSVVKTKPLAKYHIIMMVKMFEMKNTEYFEEYIMWA